MKKTTATIQPPAKAITIRQPWAWACAKGFRIIENRVWSTAFRGPVAIHASTSPSDLNLESDAFLCDAHPTIRAALNDPELDAKVRSNGGKPLPEDEQILKFGAIIGVAEIVDCIAFNPESDDPDDVFSACPPGAIPELPAGYWAEGPFCFVLANAVYLDRAVYCKGRLNLWNLTGEQQAAIVAELRRMGSLAAPAPAAV